MADSRNIQRSELSQIILELKDALERQADGRFSINYSYTDDGSDSSIGDKCTNRGNKLKKSARRVYLGKVNDRYASDIKVATKVSD